MRAKTQKRRYPGQRKGDSIYRVLARRPKPVVRRTLPILGVRFLRDKADHLRVLGYGNEGVVVEAKARFQAEGTNPDGSPKTKTRKAAVKFLCEFDNRSGERVAEYPEMIRRMRKAGVNVPHLSMHKLSVAEFEAIAPELERVVGELPVGSLRPVTTVDALRRQAAQQNGLWVQVSSSFARSGHSKLGGWPTAPVQRELVRRGGREVASPPLRLAAPEWRARALAEFVKIANAGYYPAYDSLDVLLKKPVQGVKFTPTDDVATRHLRGLVPMDFFQQVFFGPAMANWRALGTRPPDWYFGKTLVHAINLLAPPKVIPDGERERLFRMALRLADRKMLKDALRAYRHRLHAETVIHGQLGGLQWATPDARDIDPGKSVERLRHD